ncbi:MAG: hypothetical protein V4629_07205 [Pseudomonadota bacterium]
MKLELSKGITTVGEHTAGIYTTQQKNPLEIVSSNIIHNYANYYALFQSENEKFFSLLGMLISSKTSQGEGLTQPIQWSVKQLLKRNEQNSKKSVRRGMEVLNDWLQANEMISENTNRDA